MEKLSGKKKKRDEEKDSSSEKEKEKESNDSRNGENNDEDDDIIKTDDEIAFLLGKRKRLTLRKYKGKLLIDIREFYEDHCVMKPGKKGIALSKENWTKLKKFIDKIDSAIENM